MLPGASEVSPLRPGKDRVAALLSVCREDKGGQAASEIDTSAACIGGALAHEDTPEAEAGLMLIAYMFLDLHALALKGSA